MIIQLTVPWGAAGILHARREEGIVTSMPLFSSRSAVSSLPSFTYEPAHDRDRCPQGSYLLPSQQRHEHRAHSISRTADCQTGDMQPRGPATPMSGHTARRSMYRHWHLALYTAVAAQMGQPAFLRRMTERLWKIEGMIAEAKQWHGFGSLVFPKAVLRHPVGPLGRRMGVMRIL